MSSFREPREFYFDRPAAGAFNLPTPVPNAIVPDARWWIITSMVVSFSTTDENTIDAANPSYLTVGHVDSGAIPGVDFPAWRKLCWAWRVGPFLPRVCETGSGVPLHIVMPERHQLCITQLSEPASAELPLVVNLSGYEEW